MKTEMNKTLMALVVLVVLLAGYVGYTELNDRTTENHQRITNQAYDLGYSKAVEQTALAIVDHVERKGFVDLVIPGTNYTEHLILIPYIPPEESQNE